MNSAHSADQVVVSARIDSSQSSEMHSCALIGQRSPPCLRLILAAIARENHEILLPACKWDGKKRTLSDFSFSGCHTAAAPSRSPAASSCRIFSETSCAS